MYTNLTPSRHFKDLKEESRQDDETKFRRRVYFFESAEPPRQAQEGRRPLGHFYFTFMHGVNNDLCIVIDKLA